MNSILLILFISFHFILYTQSTSSSILSENSDLINIKYDRIRPIRIALTIDDYSLKDFLIVMQSVLSSAQDQSDIVFHLVACGIDMRAANILQETIVKSIKNCIPTAVYIIKPFMLPTGSGFASQLVSSKKKSHWSSPSGADMVRFFLASLFPDVERLLYVDNDVVVACCLEEIWATDLGIDKIAGIVLDDLKWATVTQFQRQYNASHPLVIQNIRRNKVYLSKTEPVTADEFHKNLPRYPNDGVLLIDVKRYNDNKCLQLVDDIARANGAGDYVVGLGTQQFTVLMLHDRWIELTPRANLRHFPDMARGYMMWFFYHGFIHFAGMAKPRAICQWGGSDNEHRTNTYTPWVTVVKTLYQTCPNEKIMNAETCLAHVPNTDTFSSFISIIDKMSNKIGSDKSLIAVRIGSIRGDLHPQRSRFGKGYKNDINTDDDSTYRIASRHSVAGRTSEKKLAKNVANTIVNGDSHDLPNTVTNIENDGLTILDRIIIHNSSWSYYVFDHQLSSLTSSKDSVKTANLPELLSNEVKIQDYNDYKKKKKNNPPRSITFHEVNICDSSQSPVDELINMTSIKKFSRTEVFYNPFIGSAEGLFSPYCKSVLESLKALDRHHWEVTGITVDVQPSIKYPYSTSLGVLKRLDLRYMRPKYVMARIGRSIHGKSIFDDATEAMKIMNRNGFISTIDREGHCNIPYRSENNNNNNNNNNDDTINYVCVWGTRFNTLELV